MISMIRWLSIVLPIALAACNTMAGFGQDMTAAGRALTGGGSEAESTAPPVTQGSSVSQSPAPAPPAKLEKPH